MFFKAGKSFLVRFILIMILSGVLPGVRHVQASPLERDNSTVLVSVQDTDGTPMAGLNVYGFNGTTYTGFHGTTDQNGQAALSLPEGSYRFRADLNGTQFWSGTANHCDTPGCTSASITVSKLVTVTVVDTDSTPKSGLNVYAFNGTTYTGYSKVTNADGMAVFTLPLGSYRFRADLNGTQFWSGTANHCNIPGCESAGVTVSKPVTVTVLDTDGAPKFGLNVYAFNGAAYTGYSKTTSADGQALFTLPLGSYRFRADLNGTQFWSGTTNHCDLPGCGTASVTVSKPATVTVLDTDNTPKSGLNVYAFNGTTYTGYSKVTNADGQAVFTLPLGSYRFRADLNGTQFWSGTSNHCMLPGCESTQITVTIPLAVVIQDGGGVPKSGVNVYAFSGSTYTGYSKVSDASGQATFTLPLGSYRFRADYLGIQYWSGSTNHCTLPGCSSTSVTVGPAMTATPLPTDTPAPTPTPVLFTISGNTGVAGAILEYIENGIVKTVSANSSGNYAIQVSPGWSGTLVPSKANVTFFPASRTYEPLQANQSEQSYTATITVINPNNSGSGSLRQAIADASSGSTIRFGQALAGQLITLSSDVIVLPHKKLILDGSGLSPQVTINGGKTAGFYCMNDSAMDIYDLAIFNLDNPLEFRIDATIKNSTLQGFTSDVIRTYASLSVIDSTLQHNIGTVIHALSSSGSLTITNSALQYNTGDAIVALSSSGSLTITDSTLSNNNGNAITSSLPLTIKNSNVSGNNGWGIESISSALTIMNTSIYQNTEEALMVNNNSHTTIVNSTIAQNQGTTAEITINGEGDVDIYNSTIIGNTNRALAIMNQTLNAHNAIVLCTHQNECFHSTGSTVNNVNSIVGSNGTLAEYGLSELADHGGPTKTMALLTGSPLIDAGDDVVCANPPVSGLDQRGVTRPQGNHCDIGAYEFVNLTASTATTITTSPNPSQLGQIVTAAVTVTSGSGTPTGTVDISVGGTVVCAEVHLSNGTGTCNMIFNAMGTLPVMAAYHPDTTGFASSSGSTDQVVERADTVTTVIDTPDLSIQGGSVNIHVTVTSPFGTPTGTVAISAGAGACNITLNDGQGDCGMTFNEAGTVTIIANYIGDAQHLPSSSTETHEVLPTTPTPSPIPTLTSIPPTPIPTSTPVVGCNTLWDQFIGNPNPIKVVNRTMYLDINNPNPYSVAISHIMAHWNYLSGRVGGDGKLWLQSITLNGTTIWTGNANTYFLDIPVSPEVMLPGNGITSRLTFTFVTTYRYPQAEELIIDFSTPGCEMYPLHVINP